MWLSRACPGGERGGVCRPLADCQSGGGGGAFLPGSAREPASWELAVGGRYLHHKAVPFFKEKEINKTPEILPQIPLKR